MNFKWIAETVYKIVRGYMVKKIADTGNQQVIDDSNKAFATIEKIWVEVVKNK